MSRKETILIVEDDADLRRFWRHTLAMEGYDVLEAGDGLEALASLEQRTPDLLILDLGLPRLGGMSVQQEIAARAPHIPVVIVTGSTADLTDLNVPCLLRKPVTTDELVRTVRSCLSAGAPGVGS